MNINFETPYSCFRKLIEAQVVKGGAPIRRATCSTPVQYRNTDILSINQSVCLAANAATNSLTHQR